MSAIDKLVSYISTLTPEQIEKIIDHLPLLTELLGEQAPPYPPEQISQIQYNLLGNSTCIASIKNKKIQHRLGCYYPLCHTLSIIIFSNWIYSHIFVQVITNKLAFHKITL